MIKSFEDYKQAVPHRNEDDNKINPPKPKFWTNADKYKPNGTPSYTLAWYQHHNDLRRQGLLNEIDQNEIQVALKGTINSWYWVLKKYPDAFKDIDAVKNIWNWDVIYPLKKGFKK